MDVSADLTELGRTPLGVVCAGCKSILDIGRTIEYLVRPYPLALLFLVRRVGLLIGLMRRAGNSRSDSGQLGTNGCVPRFLHP